MDTLGYGGVLAASKQVGESGVLTVSQCPVSVEVRRGFRWWILRSSMLYARYHPRSAHWLAMLLRTRDGYTPVSIPADVRRSPTYIPHLVREVVWLIANYDDVPDGIYHVGNVGDASMVDVASRLLLETRMQLKWEAVGRDDSARLARIPAAAFPRYGCLDHTFWSRVTRRQLPTWEEGLVEFVRVLRGS
jgi:dTDP-4-dehydrorhamnose reductase